MSSAHDRFQHRRSQQQQSAQKPPQKPAPEDQELEIEAPARSERNPLRSEGLSQHRTHQASKLVSEAERAKPSASRRPREPFAGSETGGLTPPARLAQFVSGRRKFYLIAAAVAFLLVAFAPTIAGWTPLRNSVLSSILADLNGSVSSSSASLGWFSPVTLFNVEIRDERGDLLLKIPKLKTSRTLRQFLTDSKSLGYLQIENPQVMVAFDERGSNLERALARYLDPKRPQSLECPAVELDIVSGSAVLEDRVTRRHYEIGGLDAKLAMHKDWAKPLSLQFAGKVLQQQRPGQFDAQLEVARQRQADGTIGSSGTVRLTTSQLPLALVQPIVQQLAPRTEITGWLNGEGDIAWGGATIGGDAYADQQAAGQLAVNAQFTGEGIVLRSPALPKDVLKINQIHAPCRLVVQDDQLRIDRLAASCDVGQLALDKGALIIDLRRGLTAGILDAVRRNEYSLKGRVDLAQLAKLMPETLAVRRGTEITSGTVDIEFARLPEGRSAVWQGKLTSSGLRALNEGRTVSWDNPIQMEFAALETRTGLQIRSLNCRSDFVTIQAKGQVTSPTIMAEYDLDLLAAKLSEFFDLKPARVAGRGWTQVEWQLKPEGRFDIWCETQVENFALRTAKGQAWNGEKLHVQCHLATEANPQTQRIQRLAQGTLNITAGEDRLVAKLSKAVDLASLAQGAALETGRLSARASLPDLAAPPLVDSGNRVALPEPMNERFGRDANTDDWRNVRPGLNDSPFRPAAPETDLEGRAAGLWSLLPSQGVIPLEIDLRGSLARWAARWEAVVGPSSWRVEGDCQVLATANVSQQQIEIKRSQAAIRGFRAANDNWMIDEPTLAMTIEKATYRPISRRTDVALAQAFGEKNSVALELRNVALTIPNEPNALPEIHGDVMFNVELHKIQQWSRRASQAGKPPYYIAGAADGKARFSRNGQVSTMLCSANIRDLVIRAADAKEGWRDPQVTAAADLRYDRWADVLKVLKLDVDSKTKAISCRSTGQITEMKGRRQLDLRGDVSYEMQQLALALFPKVGKEIEITSGRKPQPFFLQGPLCEPTATGNAPSDPPTPLLARLTAGTQVDWTAANIYGFRFAAGEIRAKLHNGFVHFEPLNLAVNDGRLTTDPRIDVAGRQPKVILMAGTLLNRVRITPEMCKRGLKYAAPILYGVTEAQGQFSVNIKGCEIPLDDPGRGERAGELIIHDVQVAPGPVLQSLAQAIDVLRLATGKQAATPWRAAQIKRESVVEYVMRDGRVYHRNLELDFDGIAVKTRGWVGIDQTISIEARVAAPRLARVPGLPGGIGQTEVMIPITGTLDRPQLDRSRLGDAFKGILTDEGLLRAPADGVRKELEGRAKDVLRGIDSGLEKLLPRPPR